MSVFSCGWAHCLAGNSTALFGWGDNSNGELGLGNGTSNQVSLPSLIVGFQNITKIACGTGFTLFANSFGEVFAMGLNTYGQLGLGDSSDRNFPVKLESGIPSFSTISSIAVGSSYSMVLYQCTKGYGDSDCHLVNCFGINGTQSDVCSGNGTCIANDTCSCNDGYGGSQCEYFACGGLIPTDPAVCNSHGTCNGTNECNCQSGYSGSLCQIASCFGVSGENTSAVCSGKGSCIAFDTCNCTYGFTWNECEQFMCFGFPPNSSNVCTGGNGVCIGLDNCTCYNGYIGENCAQFLCFGLAPSDPMVCNQRNGQCIARDTCECQTEWAGPQCMTPLVFISGVSSPCPGRLFWELLLIFVFFCSFA